MKGRCNAVLYKDILNHFLLLALWKQFECTHGHDGQLVKVDICHFVQLVHNHLLRCIPVLPSVMETSTDLGGASFLTKDLHPAVMMAGQLPQMKKWAYIGAVSLTH